MLYGDWGTSRFYVLGLALFYALHASFYYVIAVGVLVAAVGWAYTIICRCYPDGGGVYSAAKHTSRQLAVVGALLLFADYIVTAAMSAYDGIRYLGVPKSTVPYIAMGAILLVGFINYIGPRKAGTVALIIAMATLVLTFILTAFSVPHLAAGWAVIHAPVGPPAYQWQNLVAVVLALSGVEAIANMTGIMVPPVTRTSKKAIIPVLLEVVIFNAILAVAMNALPGLGSAPADVYNRVDDIKTKYTDWEKNPAAQKEIAEQAAIAHVDPKLVVSRSEELKDRQDRVTDVVLRVMAEEYVGKYFGVICGVVFGLLLLSAVNTAVADMVSIQYVMSRDTELPHFLTKLNVFGVPWYALIAAIGLPIGILTIFQDLNTLADLYAIGVVGAIAINLGSCCANHEMPLKKFERVGMGILAVLMTCIELTLIWDKPSARIFAAVVVVSGLTMRFATKTYPKLDQMTRAGLLLTGAAVLLITAATGVSMQNHLTPGVMKSVGLLNTEQRALAAVEIAAMVLVFAAASSATVGTRYLLRRKVAAETYGASIVAATRAEVTHVGTPPAELDMSKSHVMVATRGGQRLLDFASQYCKKTDSLLFVLFVRQVNVAFTATTQGPSLEEDTEAMTVFKNAAAACSRNGVQMIPIYVVSQDVAYTILDFAATYSVEALLMGVSRKGTMLRALQGDVLTSVADNLPQDIPLLIHA
jgi:amino acid transporter/nucleotide-binding universal stress UspA family protein